MSEVHRSTQQGPRAGRRAGSSSLLLNQIVVFVNRPEPPQDLIALSRPRRRGRQTSAFGPGERTSLPSFDAQADEALAASSSLLGGARTARSWVAWTVPEHVTKPSFCVASVTPPCHRLSRCCASAARIVVRFGHGEIGGRTPPTPAGTFATLRSPVTALRRAHRRRSGRQPGSPECLSLPRPNGCSARGREKTSLGWFDQLALGPPCQHRRCPALSRRRPDRPLRTIMRC